MNTWLSENEELEEKNQDAGTFVLIVFKVTSHQDYDANKDNL